MNKFDERSKRDLLEGLRMTVNILEANDGFVLQMNGKVVNKERAQDLRREIAYWRQCSRRKRPVKPLTRRLAPACAEITRRSGDADRPVASPASALRRGAPTC